MLPLGSLSAETFLRDYWQKRPLFIKQGWPGFVPPLSADELAGLALEDEVEARLLRQHQGQWQLAHGPFDETTFANLPERDWTLLVQAVDHWIPDAAQVLEAFRFIPDWRRDDLMVSYAAPGGSVGPHFDYYDVFLLQGEGRRTWRLGQRCTAQSSLQGHPDLMLLADFKEEACYELEPGDLLYIPPGIAHYGSCEEPSMSLSIGFRAPSQREMIDSLADFLIQRLPPERRYSDPDLTLTSDPACISAHALAPVQQLLAELAQDRTLLGEWFGRHMTQPKYPELQAQADASLPASCELQVTPGSRLAWQQDSRTWLFADGASFALAADLIEPVRALCHTRTCSLSPASSQPLRELAELLYHQGTLMLNPDAECLDDDD